MRVAGQHHAPTSLPLGNSDGTHCTGDFVDRKAYLKGFGEEKI